MHLQKNAYWIICAFTIGGFGESLAFNSKGPINCVSLNTQPCKARPTLVNINFAETLFYPFTVSVNKCDGSCNTINDSYARVCVMNISKIRIYV